MAFLYGDRVCGHCGSGDHDGRAEDEKVKQKLDGIGKRFLLTIQKKPHILIVGQ